MRELPRCSLPANVLEALYALARRMERASRATQPLLPAATLYSPHAHTRSPPLTGTLRYATYRSGWPASYLLLPGKRGREVTLTRTTDTSLGRRSLWCRRLRRGRCRRRLLFSLLLCCCLGLSLLLRLSRSCQLFIFRLHPGLPFDSRWVKGIQEVERQLQQRDFITRARSAME